jgi:hypothetical protein
MKRSNIVLLVGLVVGGVIIFGSGCNLGNKPAQKPMYTATVPVSPNKIWPDTVVNKVVGADTIRLQITSGVVTVTAPVDLWRCWRWDIYGSQQHTAASAAQGTAASAAPMPDADGDGVTDSLDNCPDTPPGKEVDATGCEVGSGGGGWGDVGSGGGGWLRRSCKLIDVTKGADVLKISVVFERF